MSALDELIDVTMKDPDITSLYLNELGEKAAAELADLRAELEARAGDANELRRNFAKCLAVFYQDNPAEIAALCDEQLDRSGALLGFVREESAKLEQKGNTSELQKP